MAEYADRCVVTMPTRALEFGVRGRPRRTDRLERPDAGAGYFDEAHFGHEFRAFTGLTPTRYVEVRRRFLREHPGHVLDSWPLPAD